MVRSLLGRTVWVSMCIGLLQTCDNNASAISLANGNAFRDTAMVSGRVSCTECMLQVMDSVVLGASIDSLVPVRSPQFARTSRGALFLFTEGPGLPVLRYDSVGRFRGVLGSLGNGPGEYAGVYRVAIGPGDSIVLIQPAGIVIQVFAPDGTFARQLTLANTEFVSEIGRAGPVLLYGKTRVPDPTTTQRQLVRLRGDGSLINTIALFEPPSGTQIIIDAGETQGNASKKEKIEEQLVSSVFPSPDGGFWATSDGNYRLEYFDSTGTPRKLFGVLVAGDEPPVMTHSEARTAVANGRQLNPYGGVFSKKSRYQFEVHRWVDVDDRGLLWIARQIPAPGWEKVAYREIQTNAMYGPEAMIPPDVFDRLSHTILEVVDPKRGTLLARHEFPFRASRVSAGFLGRVTANAEGYLTPIVYRIEFSRSP